MDKPKMKNKILYQLAIALLLLSASACTLIGLDLQEDHKHEVTLLSPEINMTALEFIKTPLEDTLRSFDRFHDAVKYAGLEEEYTRQKRTFFVFNNYAILRYNSDGTVNSNCYFARNPVPELDENGKPILDEEGEPVTRPARDWNDYPVDEVKSLLLYHIVKGEYSYHNLGPGNVSAESLSPLDTASTVYLKIENDRNSKLIVNDLQGSSRITSDRTSNLLATNGYIHVFDNSLIDVHKQ